VEIKELRDVEAYEYFIGNQLTDDGEVVSLTRRPRVKLILKGTQNFL
jgi:hypothetical protein